MTYIQNEFLDFVPGKIAEQECAENDFIYIFSHRINNRTYKKKTKYIGAIGFHPKSKKYAFFAAKGIHYICYSPDTLMLISRFIHGLETGEIKFDAEKGICYTPVLYYRNYGKTWDLTKEELE